MQQMKWEELLDKIEKLFGFIEHTTEEYPERRRTVETVVFDGASGRMMLERTVKALFLERKATYSKRVGSPAEFENIYSEDEVVDVVRYYKWNKLAGEWKEIDIFDLGR